MLTGEWQPLASSSCNPRTTHSPRSLAEHGGHLVHRCSRDRPQVGCTAYVTAECTCQQSVLELPACLLGSGLANLQVRVFSNPLPELLLDWPVQTLQIQSGVQQSPCRSYITACGTTGCMYPAGAGAKEREQTRIGCERHCKAPTVGRHLQGPQEIIDPAVCCISRPFQLSKRHEGLVASGDVPPRQETSVPQQHVCRQRLSRASVSLYHVESKPTTSSCPEKFCTAAVPLRLEPGSSPDKTKRIFARANLSYD